MVVKKYLCAAPRPESWEEKAEALLKSLDGDKAKREEVARQTLALLKERRKHEKRKAGPGRKSNAEHAIAFYEYLVGFEDKSTHDIDTDDDEKSATSSSDETIDTEEFLNQHDNVCDVCNLGGELVCCSTCTLAFHQDCVRPVMKSIPSSWSCPYCITQGIHNYKRHSKTWKSAASGIRQMNKMKLEKEIVQREEEHDEEEKNKDDTIQGTKGEGGTTVEEEESKAPNGTNSIETEQSSTKNSEKGKRKGNIEGRGDSERQASEETSRKQHSKEKVNTASSSVVSSTPSANSSVSSNSDSKRNTSLDRKSGAESLVVRSRRQRKQPSLYQPQMCADSQWKSDEKKRKADDHSDSSFESSSEDDSGSSRNSADYEVDPKSTKSNSSKTTVRTRKESVLGHEIEDDVAVRVGRAEGERKSNERIFCNFCHDDPSIPICVFCGCRVCFGKHDKSTLLLCDSCDNEYHTICLGLSSVPSTKNWYCPDCDKTKTEDVAVTRPSSKRRASAVAKAMSGTGTEENTQRRHSSKKNKAIAAGVTAAKISTTTTTRSTLVETPRRRGRGRPPKIKVENEPLPVPQLPPRRRVKTPKAAANSADPTEQQHQRKRGRPEKSTTNTSSSFSSAKATAATPPSSGRKRGRPPKTAVEAPVVTSKTASRKRGRPPKCSPDPALITNKVDSGGKKKATKPISPPVSTVSIKTSCSSTASEVAGRSQEHMKVKVSRVSGRTVKRASFHDEVDEGEQHLRASKTPQVEENQTRNGTPKAIVSKSQETRGHDRRQKEVPEKVHEPPEPTRKKQKVEEKAQPRPKVASLGSKTVSTKSDISVSLAAEDKDNEISGQPPVAPVRMKPILDPPAPPIAPIRNKSALDPTASLIPHVLIKPVLDTPAQPVRMKPVLDSSTPRLPQKATLLDNLKPTDKAENAMVSKIPINNSARSEEKSCTKNGVANTVAVAKKPMIINKAGSQSSSLPPAINTPSVAAAANAPTKSATTVNETSTISANVVQKPTPASKNEIPISSSKPSSSTTAVPNYPSTPILDLVALEAAVRALPEPEDKGTKKGITKIPRRKPGARECMQISRRFGVNIIPEKYMKILLDYCRRGKVEHLIKMRERLDCHSRFLESQLAGLEARIKEVGDSKIVVPAVPPHKRESSGRNRVGRTTPPPSLHKRSTITQSSLTISRKTTTKTTVASITSGRIPPPVKSQVPSAVAAAAAAIAAGTTPKRPAPPKAPTVAPVSFAAAPRPAVQNSTMTSKTKNT